MGTGEGAVGSVFPTVLETKTKTKEQNKTKKEFTFFTNISSLGQGIFDV